MFILGLSSSPEQSLLWLLFHVSRRIFHLNLVSTPVIRKFLSPGVLLLKRAFFYRNGT